MLKSMVSAEQEKRMVFEKQCRDQFEVMKKNIIELHKDLESKSDGLLKMELHNMEFNQRDFNNSSFPKIGIERPCLINITGSIEDMYVCGFQLFPLMGARYSQAAFFKIIAPYV